MRSVYSGICAGLSLGLLFIATDLAAEPSTLTFSQDHRRDQVFGLELEYLGRLETSESVDLQVTCLGETETPALKLHTKATANTARLINTTASDYGCSSFLIEALSGDGASVDTMSVGIAVDGIAQRELGRSSIFVFNPVHGMWTQAEEHKPNQADPTKAYASLTTTSVQAITGVIVMPDLPTPGPLSEGQLSETLGDVNPIQGLMGIPRVEPDSRGQVSVDLPLLLRPSRGPGPSFKITNSPDLGIGDLGRGWSLEISKVHVRGPSPIYHPDFETEDYHLDGQELIALDADGRDIPPLYKGGPILPRVDGVRVFRPRNSTEPLIVRRYGDGPQRYFWEVWNPGNQTTRLYGGILDGDKIAMDPQSVLTSEMPIGGATRTASGVWGLSQEFDNQPARSGARYYYHAENKDRTCSIPSQGCVQDLRIERISYNKAFGVVLTDVATSGVTQVDFVWRERARERYTSDARLGFLRFHQYWLERVDVHYEGPSDNFWLTTEGAKRLGLNPPERFFLAQKPTNQTGLDLPKQPQPSRLDPRRAILYSRHEFALTDGEDQCMNFDQVLRSVTVSANGLYNGPSAGRDLSGIGQADQSSQTFEFSYDGEKCDLEADALLWQEHNLDNPLQDEDAESGIGFPNELLSGLGLGVLTDASLLGESNTDETGASIYVGVGPNGDTSDKSISGGAKAGHSFIQSRSGSTLIDVTGDGIDDIVRRTSTGLEYCAATRAQDGSVSYPSDPNRCGRPVVGLNDIAISSSSTQSFGVEGFVPNGFFGVGYNSAVSSTYVYFTDRDGDGLIDVVVYGRVLYGQGETCPTRTTCFVQFSPESALTPPLPGMAGEATAHDILEQENRKPPGFRESVEQMKEALTDLSKRLEQLSYSQTAVAWEAPLTGGLSIGGQFRLDASAPTPEGEGLLSNGLRRFPELRMKAHAFDQYVNDCEEFPDGNHCPGSVLPGYSFTFPEVPAAILRLEISRSRRANGAQYSDKVEFCGERALPRGGVFDISQLLIGSPCARQSSENGWLLDTEAGDVLYLSYSVHPDFTGSLQPDARYEYKEFGIILERPDGTKEINLDPAFNVALRYGDYTVNEVYNCTWRDQFSGPPVETDCLLNRQNRYRFALETGLLTSNARAAAHVPRGSRREFLGEFEISTSFTQDYKISLDINGGRVAADNRRAADLPIMFSHDISRSCLSTQDAICKVTIEPICVTDQAICDAFLRDDADPWRVALRLRTEHKGHATVTATNLDSRLTSLRWLAPPRLVSEITEVPPNAELPSEEDPYKQRQGTVIEGTASKIISMYLPIALGEPDVEHRRVTHGTFVAPNPRLNEGSPSRFDIAFEKIIADEYSNVDMARGRQIALLCGFAEEIFQFLVERDSSAVQPFAPSRIEFWRAMLARSKADCIAEELQLQGLKFSDNDRPEADPTAERLKLREILVHLPFEEQVSSAETLLTRVLQNLELPRNALTSPPLLVRSGYRLPVKANPLDCGTITRSATPVESAIYGREALCSYRFLMNFAMEDIRRLFPNQTDGKPHPNRVAYESILAQFLKSEVPAFDLELSLTVNGVPALISELTGSAASNVEGNIPPASPLKQTCIGGYGAHGTKWPPVTHFYPDPTGLNTGDGGDIFQRIVTNRRPGRVVAFSDDLMHSRVPGTGSGAPYGRGLYSDLHQMEAKQDCDELEGYGDARAKYVGPATESVAVQILENNRIVGRNRIFEFEARPLDIVEFRVRLRPRERVFATVSPENVPFELNGKFSVLEVPAAATNPLPSGEYVIPRSPSQIVPPNLDPVDCGNVVPILRRELPRACRPWTRIAWSELLLGAEYRTYSDGHKTIDDKEYSIKRRRELFRLFPEIEIAADEFRLEWDHPQHRDHAPIAGQQYKDPATAYSLSIAERVATPEVQIIEDTSTIKSVEGLDNFISEFGYLQDHLFSGPERISFMKIREPNLPKIGASWLFWAQKSGGTGALSSSPAFADLRYSRSKLARPPENPRRRYDQAISACINGADSETESGNFSGCENNTKSEGIDTLSFKLSDMFPLEHRFLGPAHETQQASGVNQLITETDICAAPTPNTYASCWSGQDDTVFIHRAIGNVIQRDNSSGEHQTTLSVRSVSALIGLEQPLIEQLIFELDAMMRVACNDSRAPAEYCAGLSPSPEPSDAEKFAAIHGATEVVAPFTPMAPPPAGATMSETNPTVENVLARAPPGVPNRPNPPEPSMALHVFAPIQGSRSQSVSRNGGMDVGGLSFNTNTVFNRSDTTSLYIDINGDGYPEVLTGDGSLSAKLTSPVGLLREDWWRYFNSRTSSNPDPMGVGTSSAGYGQSSESTSRGAGFGLSPPTFAQIYQKSMDAVVSPSFDLSFESGKQTRFQDLKDFNGDGILDLLSGTNIGGGVGVQFNLGNSLSGRTDPIKVGDGDISIGRQLVAHRPFNTTHSTGFGVRLGFDINSGSIKGGMGLGTRVQGSEGVVMDFTGDGRSDIVVPISTGGKSYIGVFPNLGNGFLKGRLHEIQNWGGSESTVGETTLVDAGSAFTFGVNLLYVKIVFNPAVKRASNQTRELLNIRDVNGDGVPDLARVSGVFKNAGDGSISVPDFALPGSIKTSFNYNPDAKYHLLTGIVSPTGVQQEISYALNGNTGPELGRSIWVADRVSEFDGYVPGNDRYNRPLYGDGQDVRIDLYSYEDGYFNRAERTFYGFSEVEASTYGCDRDVGDPCDGVVSTGSELLGEAFHELRQVLRQYQNRDFLTKGSLTAEVVLGASLTEVAEASEVRPRLEATSIFEIAAARRVGYAIEHLESLGDPATSACEAPGVVAQARWYRGLFKEGSALPSKWASASSSNSNLDGAAVLGNEALCAKDLRACHAILAERTCKSGFWLEQVQFWAQQGGSMRPRFFDLHIPAPGLPISSETKIAEISIRPTDALYSASGADFDQWGQAVTSYSIGDVDMKGIPVNGSSFYGRTTYAGRNGLSATVQKSAGDGSKEYPIASLAAAETVMQGPWPQGPDEDPLRMREALYEGSSADVGTRANLTDICLYPARSDQDGFSYREGICEDFKGSMRKGLSDGLSSFGDAQRSAYSVQGLPAGTRRFSAIQHWQFSKHDPFGNITEVVSPLTDKAEWLEHRYDYRRDPFLLTPTFLETTRCVQDIVGAGESSPGKPPEATGTCGFNVGYDSDTDERTAVTHWSLQRIDPHHGLVGGSRDVNGNHLLLDFDQWGRFRLLARDWGEAPRQNKAFMADIDLATLKSEFPEATGSWNILGVANYGWPSSVENAFSSHTQMFASSNAYGGASGTFDAIRNSATFTDGVGKLVQSSVEAEVCNGADPNLLASINSNPRGDIDEQCAEIRSSRVNSGEFVDVLGREFAAFEGFSSDSGQHTLGPVFIGLAAPDHQEAPLFVRSLDGGDRPVKQQHRLAAKGLTTIEPGVLATTQSAYDIGEAEYLGQSVNRFRTLVLSPRCALTASYTDPRGLTTSAVESQDTLYRAADHPLSMDSSNTYQRDYSTTAGHCLPIENALRAWEADDSSAANAAVNYSFDPLLQLTGVEYPLAGGDRVSVFADYDRIGRMTELRDPDSGCARYQFDNLNNLTERNGFAYEADLKTPCGVALQPSEVRRFEYAADRVISITYRSLEQKAGAEDGLDAVSFFHDRYPHTTAFGELLETPRAVPNDQANQRFFDVTGKICENCIGQVTMIADRSGARSFNFNELGQIKRETRSIVAPVWDMVPSEGNPETFQPEVAFYELENSYSSFGDLTLQEFNESVPTNPSSACNAEGPETCVARFSIGTRYAPDGSVAALLFNGQPLVRSVKDGINRPSVRLMSDGTVTGFFYDPVDLRLNQMATITAAQAGDFHVPVQITGYQYDGGGNIAGYQNVAAIRENYRSHFNFTYDGANRLTGFDAFARKDAETMSASGTFSFDLGHRITGRELKIVGDPGSSFMRRWSYAYDNTPSPRQPVHAPMSIAFTLPHLEATRVSNLEYDEVGRLAKVRTAENGKAPGVMSDRRLDWDGAGRLRRVQGGPDDYWTDNSDVLHEEYVYDYAGNRVLKISRPVLEEGGEKTEAEITSIYMTPFYSRPADGRGTVQLASGDLPVASLTPPVSETAEPMVTYLYPDLAVGTVTASVLALGEITDANSTLIARREYEPFGLELTANKLAAPEDPVSSMPSVFHGKELDRTTGFSSFGARYYSRDLGFWASPDPMQMSYLFGGPAGGVYAPRNMSTYAFAGQNPITASDRSGEFLDIVLDVGFIAYDVGALAYDEFKTGGANRSENLTALAADIAGAAVPFATGGGIAVRGGIKVVDRGTDVAKVGQKAVKEAAENAGKYFTPPKTLDAFASAQRTRPKTPVQGGGGMRARWKDEKGRIFEWDSRHGNVEVYSKRGKHIGEFDPKTGVQTKPANPRRIVEP